MVGACVRIRFDSRADRRRFRMERPPYSLEQGFKARRRGIAAGNCGLHRAAILVAEDHDEFRVTVGNRIFDARQLERPRDISRDTNDEELIERAIKNQLGRDATVGTRQDRDRRILMIGGMLPQIGEMVERYRSADVRAIAFYERLPQLVAALRRGRNGEQQEQEPIAQQTPHRLSI